MEDDQKTKKPVIDWQQVFICNGWDIEVYNDIINFDFLETEYKKEGL